MSSSPQSVAPELDAERRRWQLVRAASLVIETDGVGAVYEDTCISEVFGLTIGERLSVSCAQEWCAGPGADTSYCQ